jgi:hypothetical protein
MASDVNTRTCLRGKVAAVVALASAAVLVVVGSATGSTSTATAVPRLQGTIGPGFTIALKRGTARVRLLKAGLYTFVVADKSSIHNFTLNGPGAKNRTITGTSLSARRR